MITATISTYNREKYLPQVLESLKNQTINPADFEIVIVNNNSPGNTKEISEQFIRENPQLNVSYYLETNQGLSHGRNRGIKEANGDYITFIDDDAFLKENYLEKIIYYFDHYPQVVAIGSKILLHYETVIPKWENKYLNSLLGYFNLGDDQLYFSKKNYPRGSNMSFRTSLFNEVGLFNTELGRKGSNLAGSEEKDIFQRIYKDPENKVLYVPDAIVYHSVPENRTTDEFIKKQAKGTGKGERLRVKKDGWMATFKRYILELIKWIGSFILFIGYSLKGQAAKGIMILKFRYWVSSALFFNRNDD